MQVEVQWDDGLWDGFLGGVAVVASVGSRKLMEVPSRTPVRTPSYLFM